MRLTTSRYDRTLRSEERRAIIWLGYFTVAVALRIDYQRAVEVGQRPFVNFFCNSPCPHLTVYAVDTLNILIGSWFFYTFFILLYFSEDVFHRWGRRGRQVREVFRRFANFFMFAYPVFAGAFIVISALSFFIPEQFQSAYWVLGIYSLAAVVLWLVYLVTGARNPMSEVAEAGIGGAKVIAELVIDGLLPMLERMVKRLSRGKIPPKLISIRAKVRRFLARRRGRAIIRHWQKHEAV